MANFTYDLERLNKKYLVEFVAQITDVNSERIERYIIELESDRKLKQHIVKITQESNLNYLADTIPRYGRRLGWYAIIRAFRPRVVIETGVEKGLGACVISAALLKNRAEGFPGKYLGTDIDLAAGYLFTGPYRRVGEIVYGDSVNSLRKLKMVVDVFIHDSDHSASYERREYKIIKDKLSKKAIVISDNAHATGELLGFARETERKFLFFAERPKNHWYYGAGMGVAFRKSK